MLLSGSGTKSVLVLFCGKSSCLVHNLHTKLVGSFNDLLSVLGIDIMGDHGGELLVVHQEHLDIRGGLNDEGVETILELVPGLLVGSISDLGHQYGTLELPSDSVINTSGLSPAGLQLG